MRLIDADALSDKLGEMWDIPRDWTGHMNEICEDAFDAIENESEAIVRCQDCKNWDEGRLFMPNARCCKVWSIHGITRFTGANEFCSRAERWDENETDRC